MEACSAFWLNFMLRTHIQRVFGIVILGAMASAQAQLRACASDVDQPPYLSTESRRGAGGLSIDVLAKVLEKNGQVMPKIERYPWLRCLKMAEEGEIDLVLNVPTAQIDPKPFWITEPFTVVHSVYYFSPQRFPKGLEIYDLELLKKYKLCSSMGVRYESYGINNVKVDSGAKDLLALVRKTKAGYCDLFIEKREVVTMLGQQNATIATELGQLQQRPLPEEFPVGLHFAISRRTAEGEALLAQFNLAIAELIRTKQIQRALVHYLIAAPVASASPRPKQ
jgi:polar amino acid transport system substrate-binding protein